MKILIADDDKDDLFLIKEALEESNIFTNVNMVCDGEELIGFLNKCRDRFLAFPDVILLDINMPRLNGKQVLLYLKKHPHFKHIPVVMFTTSASAHEEKECYHLGAILYLVKPPDYIELLNLPVQIEKQLKSLQDFH